MANREGKNDLFSLLCKYCPVPGDCQPGHLFCIYAIASGNLNAAQKRAAGLPVKKSDIRPGVRQPGRKPVKRREYFAKRYQEKKAAQIQS